MVITDHLTTETEMGLKVLLVDEDPGRAAILEQALLDAGHEVVFRATPDQDLYRLVAGIEPDIIIADLDSPSRDTLEHMHQINSNQPRPVVMFSRDDDEETIQVATRAGVSAYVVNGLAPERVKSVMNVAIARFREFQALKQELEKTRDTLAERKMVDRAKGILMQQRRCSEEEAFQLLRKLAMDRNQRLGEVARNLVDMAAVLN